MAATIRNSEWEEDIELENDLKEQVSRNLRQSEIVDFVRVKYPMYSWSLRTLSRRLTADRLAQLVERRTTVREASGSSPRPDQHSGS